MPYCMFKIRKANKISVIHSGERKTMFFGEFMFHPANRAHERDKQDRIVDAVERGWGDKSAWTGYVVRRKEEGSNVYEGVRFDPIFGEDQKPGYTSARLIGFLKKEGKSWAVVPEYKSHTGYTYLARDGNYIEIDPSGKEHEFGSI